MLQLIGSFIMQRTCSFVGIVGMTCVTIFLTTTVVVVNHRPPASIAEQINECIHRAESNYTTNTLREADHASIVHACSQAFIQN